MPKKSKKTPSDIVPFTPTDQPIPEKNTQSTAGARKSQASKRASSPERKSKKQKKAIDVAEDTPLVLTATEKGRVITHGEEPSLEEAALDRKKFLQLFGHLYPFGVESVFHVNIKKMKSAKSYQVMFNWLSNIGFN